MLQPCILTTSHRVLMIFPSQADMNVIIST